MPTITILESAPVLSPLVRAALPSGPVRLVPPGTGCDLAVLAPGWKGGPLPRCRVLLTPGPGGDCPAVVRYGPSLRDTLTFSSLTDAGLVLALQREVVTLTGVRVDRQEIPLARRGDPLDTLAWAGTLLLAGVPPEDLDARLAPPGSGPGSCGPRPPGRGPGTGPGGRGR